MLSYKLEATLRYKDITYRAVDDDWFSDLSSFDHENAEDVQYIYDLWTDGNFACDCNRSWFIQACYEDFPLLPCGDEIELLSLLFTIPQRPHPLLLYQKPIRVDVPADWIDEGVVILPAWELPRWIEGD